MRRIAPLVLLTALLSCGEATAPKGPVGPASLTLTPASATLDAVGRKLKLTPSPKDVNGQAVEAPTIVWSTSAPAVATVASDGQVTAVAEGDATITAQVSETVKATSLMHVRASIVFTAAPASATNAVVDQAKASASSSITVKAAP